MQEDVYSWNIINTKSYLPDNNVIDTQPNELNWSRIFPSPSNNVSTAGLLSSKFIFSNGGISSTFVAWLCTCNSSKTVGIFITGILNEDFFISMAQFISTCYGKDTRFDIAASLNASSLFVIIDPIVSSFFAKRGQIFHPIRIQRYRYTFAQRLTKLAFKRTVYAHAKLHKKKEKGGLFHLRSLLCTLQFQKLLYLRSTALMRRGGRVGNLHKDKIDDLHNHLFFGGL